MKPKILRAFINYGWNVNSRDEDGMTPLMHIMSAYLSADCVKVLVEAGADVNARANVNAQETYPNGEKLSVLDVMFAWAVRVAPEPKKKDIFA